MQGQKWNAFVLDLSFIGWDILSGMTMGILGIFYVQPYKDGTHAALYEALRYRTPYQQIQNPAPYQQNTAMNQQTTEMPNRFENQNIDQPFEGQNGLLGEQLRMDYKILIADDEPEIRNLLRLYLENENYHVIEAEDGQRALDLLRAEQPALCILDIMMPKIDGYHVLQQIRKESNIPVIIFVSEGRRFGKNPGIKSGSRRLSGKTVQSFRGSCQSEF